MVHQIVAVGNTLVAIGVEYDHALPVNGPTSPHSARVWLSQHGLSWEPVDLRDDFRNAILGVVAVRPNGSLLGIGYDYDAGPGEELSVPEVAAWESSDGRVWTPAPINYPDSSGLPVYGDQGFLGVRSAHGSEGLDHALWYSSDGQGWEQVYALKEDQYVYTKSAGAEGFVVSIGDSSTEGNVVLASGDGRTWFEASDAPSGMFIALAAVGPDWIAVRGFAKDIRGETWSSENGLDWSQLGRAELAEIRIGDDADETCTEYPHYLASTGEWLVMGTTLSYGCSEGGFVTHGVPQISLDGATWTRLPFDEATPGVTRSGSAVNASATVGGNLILAGEQDGVATFWIGEPR